MRTSSRFRRSTLGTGLSVLVVASALLVPLTSASVAQAKSTVCQKLSLAQVSAIMGVNATNVTTTARGLFAMCDYTVDGNATAISFTVSGKYTLALYKASMKYAKSAGQNPKTVSKYAPYPAFATSLSSAAFHFTTNSITILKGSNQLQVVANYSLPRVEALAKVLLMKI